MKRMLIIFTALLLVLAGLLGWQGETEVAAMLGSCAACALVLLLLFGKRGLNADLPPEAKERWRSLDIF
ncbi:hypothetical protein HLB44_19200 [Aquincola sp. S2]|uniref:Uncharacterized protein n=1 Tax=Pseudaquabacterium terrae TaxID=2732868 RepID=A0ABX2EKD8_9BURK|nr:hypothetical protein [Aquabacterium terrae]NRF69126.1 hypothetical protein [Aquabacterium terrae]